MAGATSVKLFDPFHDFSTAIASFSFFVMVFKSRFEIKSRTIEGAVEEILSVIILLTLSLSQFDFGSNN